MLKASDWSRHHDLALALVDELIRDFCGLPPRSYARRKVRELEREVFNALLTHIDHRNVSPFST